MNTKSPSASDVETWLTHRGFKPPLDVGDRRSIADAFPATRRCGIYVLRFTTDEMYVGQAVNVCRRFAQHRATHTDITALRFLRTPRTRLNETERDVIHTLERRGVLLRNFTFASAPSGESDLDLILPPEAQEDFRGDGVSFDSLVERAVFPDLRRKYAPRFARFTDLRQSDLAVGVLRTYAQSMLPSPRTTELSFWSASCLPDPYVYSRININWQEVCTVFDPQSPKLSLHVALSPLAEAFGPSLQGLRAKFRGLEIEDHRYDPGGADQVNLIIRIGKSSERLLQHTAVRTAIRLLNLRLMRKGPCTYARYHCPQLADLLLD